MPTAENDAGLVIGETVTGDTAVFLRTPGEPDVLLREKCETTDEEWALIERAIPVWSVSFRPRGDMADAWQAGAQEGFGAPSDWRLGQVYDLNPYVIPPEVSDQ